MKYIDQHVHSTISHDGVSTFEEHIKGAKERNVEEITFTEHYDDYTGITTDLKTLDVDNYRREYLKYKDDSIVKTNFGIEIGLRPESFELITKMVADNKFDFIIGSSHITCGKDMAYDKSFFDGLTPHQAISKYLNEVLCNVIIYKREFDVYGHLDYVIRYIIKHYGPVMTKVDYMEFRDLLDEILTTLITDNKGIEINTSGIRYGLGMCHPNIDILKRYKELGGRIITLGSDAHRVEDLAKDFDAAYDMLDTVGIDKIAVYHKRKPEFVKTRSL
ncbi:MAG: histidinol-phosphatase HisJ family protein [Bacilli bacterium]|nr:histidinol-phosphatase HisJ family protein [Bacilli bacterium]